MDINYFTEFVTLADAGNFTEAAERLFISQSSLSKHIKNMEKELGTILFDRTTKKLRLTEYGEILLPDARKIAELHLHYSEQLNDYKHNRPQMLKLGSVNMMPHYGITRLLSDFSVAYPSIQMDIYNDGESHLTEALVQRKCELCFMRSCELPDSEVVQLPLLDDYFVVVLSPEHPMAKEKELSLHQLQDEQFILFSGVAGTTPMNRKLFHDVDFTPNIRLHLSNYVNILDLVSHNIGLTVMTWRTARYLAHDRLAIIPLVPHSPIKLSLFYLKNHQLSCVASTFVNYVKAHASDMQLLE